MNGMGEVIIKYKNEGQGQSTFGQKWNGKKGHIGTWEDNNEGKIEK
jgi:hypothetical protein